MNWQEIKEKYPKAFDIFCIHRLKADYKTCISEYNEDFFWATISVINLRDLYDFFDEQGIYIAIIPVKSFVGELEDFEFHINFKDESFGLFRKPRQKSETAAFIKAFEILENKAN